MEDRIVALLLKKDKVAIRLIFENYGPLLMNIIKRVIRDEAMAEDVLQEVLLKVWRKGASYDNSKGSLYTWLARISRNAAIDKTRTKDFKQAETSKTAVDIVSISEAPEGEDKMEALYLREMIDGLPENQRQLIDLSFFQGYTHPEIAENLQMPLGTVKTRIRAAILHLRSII